MPLRAIPVMSVKQESVNPGYVGEIEGYRWDAQSKSYFPATRTQQVRPAQVVQAPRYFRSGAEPELANGTAALERLCPPAPYVPSPLPPASASRANDRSGSSANARPATRLPQSLLAPAGGRVNQPFR